MAKTKETKIQIKLVKSLIGCSEAQRKVAQALGFKKKDQVVEHAGLAQQGLGLELCFYRAVP